MEEVETLSGNILMCKICGATGPMERISACEAIPPWETADVRVGDIVEIYRNVWQGKYYTGLSEKPEKWTVMRLRYAPLGHTVLYDFWHPPQHHQLCIELKQLINAAGVTKPFSEKEYGQDQYNGWLFTSMTYANFCLWRRGDRSELEATGLVKPCAS